jgi:AcrR family transcriptional regulator
MARKSAEDRKAEILATALRLADELGPDRLTTNAVAEAVGLTQPGIFRHFPSKQALWQAVAADISGRLKSAWDEALAASATPEDRIAALVQAQLRLIEAHPAIPAILFSRELRVENGALRQTFVSLMTAFRHPCRRTGKRDAVSRISIGGRRHSVDLTRFRAGDALVAELRVLPCNGGVRLLAVQMALFTGSATEGSSHDGRKDPGPWWRGGHRQFSCLCFSPAAGRRSVATVDGMSR